MQHLNAPQLLSLSPVLPVVTLNNANHAVATAAALLEGGIAVLEITLRTAAALTAIRQIKHMLPEMRVGAGTIIHPAQIEAAAEAGADFAISPGCNHSLLHTARNSPITFIPGIATPSELMLALEYGFDTVKLFPAEAVGGVSLLKALHGPFPDVRFCPTGGITVENAGGYLKLPNVLCVGGSWLAPPPLLANQDWHAITQLARTAITLRQ